MMHNGKELQRIYIHLNKLYHFSHSSNFKVWFCSNLVKYDWNFAYPFVELKQH